ncbi:MAG: hypothetical protein SynsKO_41800 [Synoicihabitans sp.]
MKRVIGFIIALASAPALVQASDAYIPAPGTGNLYPVASLQWATDFWFNDTPATLPGHLTQTTVGADLEYGVAENVAVDLSLGFSMVNYQGGPVGGALVLTRDGQNTRHGMTDTRFGVSYRILDEFQSINEAAPTITLRLGGIIRGTYDTGFLNAVSDGANGVEAGVKFGKVFIGSSAGIYGDFAYRWLSSTIPDEWEVGLGVYKTWGKLTYSTGFREKHAVDGLDILGPGFTLAGFPDVKEINRSMELGVTWNFKPNSFISLGYARTLEGENTPKKNVIVTSMNINL